jgi:serine/threonine protein kinase
VLNLDHAPAIPANADKTGKCPTGGSAVIPTATLPSAEDSSFLERPTAPGELGRLGPFRVLEVLGSGAASIVFRAEDTQLRRVVALKVLRPDIAANVESRRRFLREARAGAALEHDNILTIHQVGEDRDIPWLTMKLLRGQSLKDRLGADGSKLPAREALRIGAEVADALAAAHARGLVHRDVKPSNILLEESTGRVKLIDFGLALVHDDEGQLTRSGFVVGTPSYMAPEQADGMAVDPRTDLYALGCVLYRCCTGKLPFEGDSVLQVFYAQRTEQPIAPRNIDSAIPDCLSALILKLLAKTPADRPHCAADLRDAMRRMRADLEVSGPPTPDASHAPQSAFVDTKQHTSLDSTAPAEVWALAVSDVPSARAHLIRAWSSESWRRRLPDWFSPLRRSAALLLSRVMRLPASRKGDSSGSTPSVQKETCVGAD